MDEMTWTDPQLKARYERNLKAMEQRRAAHPELLNKWAVPYKVFTRSSLHGIQNMRINWLMDNHPQQFREMMMANVETANPSLADVDCGRDDSPNPSDKGARIYNYDGSEYGVSLGQRGDGPRITVLWPDGSSTHPDTRGILFKDGRWKIC